MSDKFFLDSNICVYFFDNDRKKAIIPKSLFTAAALVSTQALAETGNVLIKKLHFKKEDTCEAIRFIRNTVEVKPLTAELFDIAFAVFIRYSFSFYDSIIIASALNANCSILYSEDLQHKQVIENKLTIVNPFV